MQSHDEHNHDEDDNHEHEDSTYDEHVWTSPVNAIKIIEEFSKEIQMLDEKNSELYKSNTEKYINEIKEIDEAFREIVNSSNKKEIIFADRFPAIYFVKEYGLDYYAAFPGCFSESEVSAKTLSFLIDKIKKDDIKYVFHLELSNEKVANMLAEQTGVRTLLFHTAHNVSKEEIASTMRANGMNGTNVLRNLANNPPDNVENQISAYDAGQMLYQMVTDKVSPGKDFITSYFRISDNYGRNGIGNAIPSDALFLNHNASTSSKYNEIAYVESGDAKFILVFISNGGKPDINSQLASDIAGYVYQSFTSQ